MDERNVRIDSLRGMACFLLVAYHVIGTDPNNGLKLSSGFYRDVADVLVYLRMPLFTFLSGVVYAYRPFREGARDFIAKKARRLLFPMLTVGTAFAVVQSMVPGANTGIENWHMLHIIPVGHFWFVESLFLLFLSVVVLEKLHLLDGPKSFFWVFLAASILYVSPIRNNYFSFSGFLYLLPYFLIGMAVYRYDLLAGLGFYSKTLLALVAALIYILIYFRFLPEFDTRSLAGLLLGLASCLVIISLGFKSGFLAAIGVFSYSIYLFHVFFAAGARIFLLKIGFSNLDLMFLAGLFSGIGGPILTELVLRTMNFSRVLFLGKAPFKRERAALSQAKAN